MTGLPLSKTGRRCIRVGKGGAGFVVLFLIVFGIALTNAFSVGRTYTYKYEGNFISPTGSSLGNTTEKLHIEATFSIGVINSVEGGVYCSFEVLELEVHSHSRRIFLNVPSIEELAGWLRVIFSYSGNIEALEHSAKEQPNVLEWKKVLLFSVRLEGKILSSMDSMLKGNSSYAPDFWGIREFGGQRRALSEMSQCKQPEEDPEQYSWEEKIPIGKDLNPLAILREISFRRQCKTGAISEIVKKDTAFLLGLNSGSDGFAKAKNQNMQISKGTTFVSLKTVSDSVQGLSQLPSRAVRDTKLDFDQSYLQRIFDYHTSWPVYTEDDDQILTSEVDSKLDKIGASKGGQRAEHIHEMVQSLNSLRALQVFHLAEKIFSEQDRASKHRDFIECLILCGSEAAQRALASNILIPSKSESPIIEYTLSRLNLVEEPSTITIQSVKYFAFGDPYDTASNPIGMREWERNKMAGLLLVGGFISKLKGNGGICSSESCTDLLWSIQSELRFAETKAREAPDLHSATEEVRMWSAIIDSIGNSGLREFKETLKAYAYDSELPESIRISAILSLRYVCEETMNEVIKNLTGMALKGDTFSDLFSFLKTLLGSRTSQRVESEAYDVSQSGSVDAAVEGTLYSFKVMQGMPEKKGLNSLKAISSKTLQRRWSSFGDKLKLSDFVSLSGSSPTGKEVLNILAESVDTWELDARYLKSIVDARPYKNVLVYKKKMDGEISEVIKGMKKTVLKICKTFEEYHYLLKTSLEVSGSTQGSYLQALESAVNAASSCNETTQYLTVNENMYLPTLNSLDPIQDTLSVLQRPAVDCSELSKGGGSLYSHIQEDIDLILRKIKNSIAQMENVLSNNPLVKRTFAFKNGLKMKYADVKQKSVSLVRDYKLESSILKQNTYRAQSAYSTQMDKFCLAMQKHIAQIESLPKFHHAFPKQIAEGCLSNERGLVHLAVNMKKSIKAPWKCSISKCSSKDSVLELKLGGVMGNRLLKIRNIEVTDDICKNIGFTFFPGNIIGLPGNRSACSVPAISLSLSREVKGVEIAENPVNHLYGLKPTFIHNGGGNSFRVQIGNQIISHVIPEKERYGNREPVFNRNFLTESPVLRVSRLATTFRIAGLAYSSKQFSLQYFSLGRRQDVSLKSGEINEDFRVDDETYRFFEQGFFPFQDVRRVPVFSSQHTAFLNRRVNTSSIPFLSHDRFIQEGEATYKNAMKDERASAALTRNRRSILDSGDKMQRRTRRASNGANRQPLVCDAGGPYFVSCQEAADGVVLNLRGTQVSNYKWTTTCEGGYIVEEGDEMKLKVSKCPEKCFVTLQVRKSKSQSPVNCRANVKITTRTIPTLHIPDRPQLPCGDDQSSAYSVSSNCGNSARLLIENDELITVDDICAANKTLLRTWSGKDNCKKKRIIVTEMEIHDTEPPFLLPGTDNHCLSPPNGNFLELRNFSSPSALVNITDKCSNDRLSIQFLYCSSSNGDMGLCFYRSEIDTLFVQASADLPLYSLIVSIEDTCMNKQTVIVNIQVVNEPGPGDTCFSPNATYIPTPTYAPTSTNTATSSVYVPTSTIASSLTPTFTSNPNVTIMEFHKSANVSQNTEFRISISEILGSFEAEGVALSDLNLTSIREKIIDFNSSMLDFPVTFWIDVDLEDRSVRGKPTYQTRGFRMIDVEVNREGSPFAAIRLDILINPQPVPGAPAVHEQEVCGEFHFISDAFKVALSVELEVLHESIDISVSNLNSSVGCSTYEWMYFAEDEEARETTSAWVDSEEFHPNNFAIKSSKRKPFCESEPTYIAQCTQNATFVNVSLSSAHVVPFPPSFYWATNCPGSFIVNPYSPNATLVYHVPGHLPICTVYLTVGNNPNQFCSSSVILHDTLPPTFDELSDLNLNCYDPFVPTLSNLFDLCDPNPQYNVTSVAIPTNSSCASNTITQYTFTAFDASGNTAYATQTVSSMKLTPPAIFIPSLSPQCLTVNPPFTHFLLPDFSVPGTFINVTDPCVNVSVTYISCTAIGPGNCEYLPYSDALLVEFVEGTNYTVSISVDDQCGNTLIAMKEIFCVASAYSCEITNYNNYTLLPSATISVESSIGSTVIESTPHISISSSALYPTETSMGDTSVLNTGIVSATSTILISSATSHTSSPAATLSQTNTDTQLPSDTHPVSSGTGTTSTVSETTAATTTGEGSSTTDVLTSTSTADQSTTAGTSSIDSSETSETFVPTATSSTASETSAAYTTDETSSTTEQPSSNVSSTGEQSTTVSTSIQSTGTSGTVGPTPTSNTASETTAASTTDETSTATEQPSSTVSTTDMGTTVVATSSIQSSGTSETVGPTATSNTVSETITASTTDEASSTTEQPTSTVSTTEEPSNTVATTSIQSSGTSDTVGPTATSNTVSETTAPSTTDETSSTTAQPTSSVSMSEPTAASTTAETSSTTEQDTSTASSTAEQSTTVNTSSVESSGTSETAGPTATSSTVSETTAASTTDAASSTTELPTSAVSTTEEPSTTAATSSIQSSGTSETVGPTATSDTVSATTTASTTDEASSTTEQPTSTVSSTAEHTVSTSSVESSGTSETSSTTEQATSTVSSTAEQSTTVNTSSVESSGTSETAGPTATSSTVSETTVASTTDAASSTTEQTTSAVSTTEEPSSTVATSSMQSTGTSGTVDSTATSNTVSETTAASTTDEESSTTEQPTSTVSSTAEQSTTESTSTMESSGTSETVGPTATSNTVSETTAASTTDEATSTTEQPTSTVSTTEEPSTTVDTSSIQSSGTSETVGPTATSNTVSETTATPTTDEESSTTEQPTSTVSSTAEQSTTESTSTMESSGTSETVGITATSNTVSETTAASTTDEASSTAEQPTSAVSTTEEPSTTVATSSIQSSGTSETVGPTATSNTVSETTAASTTDEASSTTEQPTSAVSTTEEPSTTVDTSSIQSSGTSETVGPTATSNTVSETTAASTTDEASSTTEQPTSAVSATEEPSTTVDTSSIQSSGTSETVGPTATSNTVSETTTASTTGETSSTTEQATSTVSSTAEQSTTVNTSSVESSGTSETAGPTATSSTVSETTAASTTDAASNTTELPTSAVSTTEEPSNTVATSSIQSSGTSETVGPTATSDTVSATTTASTTDETSSTTEQATSTVSSTAEQSTTVGTSSVESSGTSETAGPTATSSTVSETTAASTTDAASSTTEQTTSAVSTTEEPSSTVATSSMQSTGTSGTVGPTATSNTVSETTAAYTTDVTSTATEQSTSTVSSTEEQSSTVGTSSVESSGTSETVGTTATSSTMSATTTASTTDEASSTTEQSTSTVSSTEEQSSTVGTSSVESSGTSETVGTTATSSAMSATTTASTTDEASSTTEQATSTVSTTEEPSNTVTTSSIQSSGTSETAGPTSTSDTLSETTAASTTEETSSATEQPTSTVSSTAEQSTTVSTSSVESSGTSETAGSSATSSTESETTEGPVPTSSDWHSNSAITSSSLGPPEIPMCSLSNAKTPCSSGDFIVSKTVTNFNPSTASWITNCTSVSFVENTQLGGLFSFSSNPGKENCWIELTLADSETSISCSEYIIFTNALPPVLTVDTEPRLFSCSEAVDMSGPVSADDECDGNIPVVFYVENIPGGCYSNRTYIKYFNATDSFGNVASKHMVVAVEDRSAPSLVGDESPTCFFSLSNWNYEILNFTVTTEIPYGVDDCGVVSKSFLSCEGVNGFGEFAGCYYDIEQDTILIPRDNVAAYNLTYRLSDPCGNYLDVNLPFYIHDSSPEDPSNCTMPEINSPEPTPTPNPVPTPTANITGWPGLKTPMIDTIVANVSRGAFELIVPPDTFWDEHLNHTYTIMRLGANQQLPSWLEFDPIERRFYGVPLAADAQIDVFILTAHHHEGLSDIDIVTIEVRNIYPVDPSSPVFTMALNYQYEFFGPKERFNIVHDVAAYLGIDTEYIRILDFRPGSIIVEFSFIDIPVEQMFKYHIDLKQGISDGSLAKSLKLPVNDIVYIPPAITVTTTINDTVTTTAVPSSEPAEEEEPAVAAASVVPGVANALVLTGAVVAGVYQHKKRMRKFALEDEIETDLTAKEQVIRKPIGDEKNALDSTSSKRSGSRENEGEPPPGEAEPGGGLSRHSSRQSVASSGAVSGVDGNGIKKKKRHRRHRKQEEENDEDEMIQLEPEYEPVECSVQTEFKNPTKIQIIEEVEHIEEIIEEEITPKSTSNSDATSSKSSRSSRRLHKSKKKRRRRSAEDDEPEGEPDFESEAAEEAPLTEKELEERLKEESKAWNF
eukprot:Nk52_evm4s2426 gene=Nk52_evmTU4s2426